MDSVVCIYYDGEYNVLTILCILHLFIVCSHYRHHSDSSDKFIISYIVTMAMSFPLFCTGKHIYNYHYYYLSLLST